MLRDKAKNLLVLCGALVWLMPSGAVADYAVTGAGAVSCGKFGDQYRAAPTEIENLYFAWAQGYLSGMNGQLLWEHRPTIDLSKIPTRRQKQIIRRYCNQHPRGSYYGAVLDLWVRLSAARGKHP